MLSLYAAPGACSRVPMIALEEAGQAYDLKLVRFLAGAHKSPEYLALNPNGKVPCLVTEDGVLTENVAILRFLAVRFPGLLPEPASPYQDARILSDLAFCASSLHPIVSRMRVPMFMADTPEAISSIKNKAMEAMGPMATLVEGRLSAGDWWFGETWSVMDAYLYWLWYRITGGGFPADDYPLWSRHADRMDARPAVARALEKEAALQAILETEGLVPDLT